MYKIVFRNSLLGPYSWILDTSLENRQKRGDRLAEIAGPAIIEGKIYIGRKKSEFVADFTFSC